ncbi:MAG TPA: shikimate kinase [Rectinemataceae bacterium]|nr:shikimate kinase [Rectinemataceae bacterium]
MASTGPLIVITGFMGTGKTTVGRLLARRLGLDFADMDLCIEAEEGAPVAAIFRERGEAYFRARERHWCERLSKRDSLVVSTGGGALVDARNLACFSLAFVVCLEAEPEELLARLAAQEGRPLLEGPDPRERVARLMAERREAYARIAWHLDTSGKTADQVADEIMAVLGAQG